MRKLLLILCCLPVFSRAQVILTDSMQVVIDKPGKSTEDHKKNNSIPQAITTPGKNTSTYNEYPEKKQRWISHFYIALAPFNADIYNNDASSMSVHYVNAAGNLQVNQSIPVSTYDSRPGILFTMEYEWWKHLVTGVRIYGEYAAPHTNIIDLGLSWKQCIASINKHKIYLTPGIDYDFFTIRKSINQVDNPTQNAVIESTTFTDDKVNVTLETIQHNIKPRLRLDFNITHYSDVSLFIEAGCVIPVNQHDQLIFDEEHGDDDDNSYNVNQSIPLTSSSIDFRKDNHPSTEMPYHPIAFFNIGLRCRPFL